MKSFEQSDLVAGSEAVTEYFGDWPGFHDAEVLRIEIDREEPTLAMEIDTFRTSQDVDGAGYLIRHPRAVVRLLFRDIDDVSLCGFNHQNAIAGLNFERLDSRISVRIDASYGLGGTFTCSRIEAVRLVPLG